MGDKRIDKKVKLLRVAKYIYIAIITRFSKLKLKLHCVFRMNVDQRILTLLK